MPNEILNSANLNDTTHPVAAAAAVAVTVAAAMEGERSISHLQSIHR